jgi:hypothetical protein
VRFWVNRLIDVDTCYFNLVVDFYRILEQLEQEKVFVAQLDPCINLYRCGAFVTCFICMILKLAFEQEQGQTFVT